MADNPSRNYGRGFCRKRSDLELLVVLLFGVDLDLEGVNLQQLSALLQVVAAIIPLT